MTLLQESQPTARRHVVGWAWLCVALIPAGFALSVGALFALATWMDVDLLPDRGAAQVSVAQGLLLGCTSTLIALAAPTTAVILAIRAERAGERSARWAGVVSIGLLALAVLAYTMLVSLFGLLGLTVVSVVLYVALRERSSP